MPRVTEVIGYLIEPELLNWMLKNPEKKRNSIRDEAFRVGRLVDETMQMDISEGGYLTPEGDEPVENCLKAWEDFKRVHPEFVGSVVEMQTTLEDKEINLTGHPDFVIERDGEWGVVDLKCSSGIRPSYWTQTSQYSEMIRKARGWDKPRFVGVLRLDKKEGTWEYKEIVDETFIRYEVEVFKAMLLLFKHGESVREQLRGQLEAELLGG